MPDPTNLQPQEGENVESTENTEQAGNVERFETDAKKIVNRHLEDEQHEITDEEMRGIRVGMTPPELDTATEARFEDEEAIKDAEDEFLGDRKDIEEDKNTGDDKLTPWDTIK